MANRNDESRQNLKVVKEDILRRERFLGERDVGARQQWNRLAGGAKDSFVVYENYKTVYKGKNAQKVKYHGPVQQKRGKPPVPHGVGTMTYTNGYVLRGPFKAGRRHGTFSVTTSDDKDKVQACFREDVYKPSAPCKKIPATSTGRREVIYYTKQIDDRSYYHGPVASDGTIQEKGTMYFTNGKQETIDNVHCFRCAQCLVDFGGMSPSNATHALEELTQITRLLAQKSPNQRRLNALYESLLDRLPVLQGSNPNDFGINAGNYYLGNQVITVPDLTKVKPLGEGTFGIVYKGSTHRDGTSPIPIAIKLPKVNLCDGYKAADCRKEEGCRWSLDKSTKPKRKVHKPTKDDYTPTAVQDDVEWKPDNASIDLAKLQKEATMNLAKLRRKLAKFEGGGKRGECLQESFKYATPDEMAELKQSQYAFMVESMVHLLLACIRSTHDVLSMVAPRPIFVARTEPRYMTRGMEQELAENYGIQRRTIVVGMEALEYDGWVAVEKKGVVDTFNMLVQSAYMLSLCNQHGVRFVHRDFHPGNIMCVVHKRPQRIRIPVGNGKHINYSTRVVWKIIDFGMSCIYTDCCDHARHGWLIASQEDTPYSEKPLEHCKNRFLDMRMMIYALYDYLEEKNWFKDFFDLLFGDDTPDIDDWHDGYYDKFTARDKKIYAPEHVIRVLYEHLKKNPLRSVSVK